MSYTGTRTARPRAHRPARKYSVDEIDRMRAALGYWLSSWDGHLEDQLRTYMLNGTEPAELEAKARRFAEEQQRLCEEQTRARTERHHAYLQRVSNHRLRKTFLKVDEPEPIDPSRYRY